MTFTACLTAQDLQRWRACPRDFWLSRHEAQTTAPHTARLPAGVADPGLRATFPMACTIAPPDASQGAWDRAIADTRNLLEDGFLALSPQYGRAIFGACLRSNDGVQVRIDVMVSGGHGLKLYKVRQATAGDDNDVEAVALWAHVAARCGLRLQGLGLMLIDMDFIYPGHGCYAGMYREVDLAPMLGSRQVATWITAMRGCEREDLPAVPPDAPCQQHRACAWSERCGVATARPSTPPHSLEVVGRELAMALREEGHVDLRSVPEERMPDGRRLRALRAVQNEMPVLHAQAGRVLQALPYPRHTLRFDTIGFATPIWPGTRPYQVVPFQWTCDTLHADGRLQQSHFLADAPGDPRRAFATSLLAAVGTTGAILAYNAGFERKRIQELADCFEDLATDLECLLPRIVDLFQLARAHYYHPAMCGSWSFKSVCRAIAPDLPVDRFNWRGEHQTQVAFARAQLTRLTPEDWAELRAALVQHGHVQTEALRRLAALFERTAQQR